MVAVTIAGDRAANLGLCSAPRAFEKGGIFIVPHLLWHGLQFIRSHLKDWHPRPTVGFEPPTQGLSDLCTDALTTAQLRRLGTAINNLNAIVEVTLNEIQGVDFILK
jgi:hypothetical protein